MVTLKSIVNGLWHLQLPSVMSKLRSKHGLDFKHLWTSRSTLKRWGDKVGLVHCEDTWSNSDSAPGTQWAHDAGSCVCYSNGEHVTSVNGMGVQLTSSSKWTKYVTFANLKKARTFKKCEYIAKSFSVIYSSQFFSPTIETQTSSCPVRSWGPSSWLTVVRAFMEI